jgi:hypothetical protein
LKISELKGKNIWEYHIEKRFKCVRKDIRNKLTII